MEQLRRLSNYRRACLAVILEKLKVGDKVDLTKAQWPENLFDVPSYRGEFNIIKKGRKYTLEELQQIAENDQTEDINRPWNYTSYCNLCGGVKSFLDWLEHKHIESKYLDRVAVEKERQRLKNFQASRRIFLRLRARRWLKTHAPT